MELVNFLILLLVGILQTNLTSCEMKRHYGQDEPRCYSRFDYDYKIVQRLAELEHDYSELKAVNDELLEQIGELKKKNSERSIYTRWGKNECPDNDSKIVYRGYAAGRHHLEGGGTNLLCLPEKPNWNRYSDSADSYRGHIWGAEIDMDVDSEGKVFEDRVDGKDMPCAVCMTSHSITHMFPGRATCFSGWSMEYSGYLMTNYRKRAHNMEYICLDARPEGIPHGDARDHENVLYLVEARCGSLPCPPYVEGRELACAVCSK